MGVRARFALTYVRTYVRCRCMNATKLRAELYTVLDQVLETGKPVIIERKGKKLRLSVEKEQKPIRRKWSKPRPELLPEGVTIDDIMSVDWSKEWKP